MKTVYFTHFNNIRQFISTNLKTWEKITSVDLLRLESLNFEQSNYYNFLFKNDNFLVYKKSQFNYFQTNSKFF